MMIEVVRAGAMTTIQDLGRPGWRAMGVPAGGAMDPWSARAANLLVGNPEDAALLEFTLTGPQLVFDFACRIALTGAPFEAHLNEDELPHCESVDVQPGASLRIGASRIGARGYLAVSGGLDVPRVLGSMATATRQSFGGLKGRALKSGDHLDTKPANPARPARAFDPADLPHPQTPYTLRFLSGPQADAFEDDCFALMESAVFRFAADSDRMGLRLDGPRLSHRRSAEIAPEGLVCGAVQVPADGRPIILGPDMPTTGGYAKIATIIAADLATLAYARPGDEIRFRRVTIDEARDAWSAREAVLKGGSADP